MIPILARNVASRLSCSRKAALAPGSANLSLRPSSSMSRSFPTLSPGSDLRLAFDPFRSHTRHIFFFVWNTLRIIMKCSRWLPAFGMQTLYIP